MADQKPLKIGLVGLDSSHATAFTKSVNANPSLPGLENAKIVAAFPGGSPDLPTSADRVEGYTKTLREAGVQIVGSIEELLPLVDTVIITSVDGRVHLDQARKVIAAGKPLFVDKPLSTSVKDGAEIFALAKAKGVPCFTSSSLRFAPGVADVRSNPALGNVIGCAVFSPSATQIHHPDLFWYGIHGVEMVFTVMGPGCETVSCTRTDGVDVVVGTWKDGRVATYRGMRDGKPGYGLTAFGSKGNVTTAIKVGYDPMLVEILKFFRTGVAPVSNEDSLEILAFMEAANESHRQGGKPVKLNLGK